MNFVVCYSLTPLEKISSRDLVERRVKDDELTIREVIEKERNCTNRVENVTLLIVS